LELVVVNTLQRYFAKFIFFAKFDILCETITGVYIFVIIDTGM